MQRSGMMRDPLTHVVISRETTGGSDDKRKFGEAKSLEPCCHLEGNAAQRNDERSLECVNLVQGISHRNPDEKSGLLTSR